MNEAELAVATPLEEYLTFTLGNEEYGVDILRVQEIRRYDTVTRVPNAPGFVKGVINLRGTIVPVVDMRLRFGLGEPRYDTLTVMIILNIHRRVVGMVVDSVSDVLSLDRQNIKPPPEFGSTLDTRYISGLAAEGERMLILVDIERLMSSPEMALQDDPRVADQGLH